MKLDIAYKCLDFGLIQGIQHDLNLNFYPQKKNRTIAAYVNLYYDRTKVSYFIRNVYCFHNSCF